MDAVIENDTFHMLLTNEQQKENGEFDIEFKKPIEFKRNMECALIDMNISNNIKSSRFSKGDKLCLNVIFYLTEAGKFDNIAKVDKLELVYDINKYFDIESKNYTEKDLEELFKKINDEAKVFIDAKKQEFGDAKLMIQQGREVNITYPTIGIEDGNIFLSAGGIKVNYEPLTIIYEGSYDDIFKEWIIYEPDDTIAVLKTEGNKKKFKMNPEKGALNKLTKYWHDIKINLPSALYSFSIEPSPRSRQDDIDAEERVKDISNLRGYSSVWIPRAVFFFKMTEKQHQTFGFNNKNFPLYNYSTLQFDYSNLFYPINDYENLLRKQIAPNKPKLEETNSTFFIYCNIIKESHIGNQKVNILRVFPREKSDQHNVSYVFHSLLYIPVRVQSINSITISVRNEMGNIMNIQGDISALLIFRPIEYT
jgi:hypothetical protein